MAATILILFTIGIIIASPAVGQEDDQAITGNRNDEKEAKDVNFDTCFCKRERQHPRDCGEIYYQCEGGSLDGVHTIKPIGSKEPFEVYCNNTIDGGGWTVFQRRVDGLVNFNRNWDDYKEGFGFLNGDFWLGNDKIFLLTNQKNYEIRIDLVNLDGTPFFAKYKFFRISDESCNYRLVKAGQYNRSSTAPSVFSWHVNQPFSTPDRDNTLHRSRVNCADRNRSAWWYINCYRDTDLNSPLLGKEGHPLSPYWYSLPGNEFLMYTEMKLRPV